jgi:hypothetical protein
MARSCEPWSRSNRKLPDFTATKVTFSVIPEVSKRGDYVLFIDQPNPVIWEV